MHPIIIMKWQKPLFKSVVDIFSLTRKDTIDKTRKSKIKKREKQLARRDMVIASLTTKNPEKITLTLNRA